MEHEHHHDHKQKSDQGSQNHKHENTSNHHTQMVHDFLKRFWVFIALSVTIITLSPLTQEFFGLRDSLFFSGDVYVSVFLSSVIIYFYGIILNPAVEHRLDVYKYSNSYN